MHGVRRLADVALAVTEACTNVVIHAYLGHDPGPLRLSGRRDRAAVTFVVADHGRGLVPRTDSPGLGMGLPLIAQLADHFELSDNGARGTRVQMRFATHETPPPRPPSPGGHERPRAHRRSVSEQPPAQRL
jgi:anti-sigma regulatory factor (Ser/Thr protein kinase)